MRLSAMGGRATQAVALLRNFVQRIFVGMLAVSLLLALQLNFAAGAFDSKPWRDDLSQARTAFELKYANWEWAAFERQADLPKLFQDADRRVEGASSAAEAKSAFNRLIERLGEGHVDVEWPAPSKVARLSPQLGLRSETVIPVCGRLGYDSKRAGAPVAALARGYKPLPADSAPKFPAGVLHERAKIFGVLRIGEFGPQDSPELCAAALERLAIKPDAACDDACSDRVETEAYTLISQHLANRLRELRAAGAITLVVDVTNNGGGSEWAEIAARVISARPIKSETLGFVRDAHWVEK